MGDGGDDEKVRVVDGGKVKVGEFHVVVSAVVTEVGKNPHSFLQTLRHCPSRWPR